MTTKRTIPRILYYVKPYKRPLAIAMVCMVIVASMAGAQAYMVKPLLDEIFFNKDQSMLLVVPLMIMGIFLVKGFFYYIYNYLLVKVGQSVIRDLRNMLYSHIQSLPLSFFHRKPTGELISRIISDVTLIQGAVSNVLVGILKDTFQVLFLIGVIFYQDWRMASIAMISLPLVVYPIVNFGRRHRRLSRSDQQITAQVTNILYETITGNRIVKAFGMEKYEITRFAETLDRLFAVVMRNTRIGAISSPLMEILGGVGISLVVWYVGSHVAHAHDNVQCFLTIGRGRFHDQLILRRYPCTNNNSCVKCVAGLRNIVLVSVRSNGERGPAAARNDSAPLAVAPRTYHYGRSELSYAGSERGSPALKLLRAAGRPHMGVTEACQAALDQPPRMGIV